MYGMNVMLRLFRKIPKKRNPMETSFYATGKKDGWLIAIVLLSQEKLVFPPHLVLPDCSHLFM